MHWKLLRIEVPCSSVEPRRYSHSKTRRDTTKQGKLDTKTQPAALECHLNPLATRISRIDPVECLPRLTEEVPNESWIQIYFKMLKSSRGLSAHFVNRKSLVFDTTLYIRDILRARLFNMWLAYEESHTRESDALKRE